MTQQINFLKNIPKQAFTLTTSMISGIVLGTFILLIVLSIGVSIYVSIENRALGKIAIQKQQETLAFQKLAQDYPLLASDTPLVTKVANYENTLRQKQADFAALSHTTSRLPLSQYLTTLAVATPNGLWLKHISVSEETGNISLSGFAIKFEYIPLFIQKLQTMSPFTGITFDLLPFKKNEKTGLIEFEIANNYLLKQEEATDAPPIN